MPKANMRNQAMLRAMRGGLCLDISESKRLGPYYVLEAFTPDVDYADGATEEWIWSIGQCDRDFHFPWQGTMQVARHGTILASTRNDLYQRDGITCLWLR